jgi:transcription initiation factor TFIIF subunit beta
MSVSDSSLNGDDGITENSHVIDVSHASRRIWLVKLPDFLMERWSELQEQELELGSVRLYDPVPGQPPRVTLCLNGDPRWKDLPPEFDISFLRNVKPSNVFSECNGTPIAIEGTIDQECNVQPKLTPQYQNLLRQRHMDASRPKRSIKLLDSSAESRQIGLIAPVSEAQLLMNKKKRLASPETKKERLPREELMDLLFTAFEKYSFWSFKGLVEYTNQPAVFLKELLAEIAIYNTRGPYKTMYQLKPEFERQKAPSPDAAPRS